MWSKIKIILISIGIGILIGGSVIVFIVLGRQKEIPNLLQQLYKRRRIAIEREQERVNNQLQQTQEEIQETIEERGHINEIQNDVSSDTNNISSVRTSIRDRINRLRNK